MERLIGKERIEQFAEVVLGRKETIAVAESVTAGLLQHSIATAGKAMQFFQGGMTAYNIGQKVKHLGVEPIHAFGTSCVSDRVASQMALGCLELFGSDWSLAITGFASPVPESDETVYAWFAIARKGEIVHSERLEGEGTDELSNQQEFARKALIKFMDVISQTK